jgi:hypothetical protein
MKKIYALLCLILFAGCVPAQKDLPSPVTVLPPTVTPVPTPVPTPLPTPFAPGDLVVWNDLQVSMLGAEITDSYVNKFGSQRKPTQNRIFLWVHVQLENTGQDNLNLPGVKHFSALYAATEFNPAYGHRQGHPDYTALGPTLFPGQKVDAWLRFDLPATATLKDVQFIFMPESFQLGVLASSPTFPWGGRHPIYVWFCER